MTTRQHEEPQRQADLDDTAHTTTPSPVDDGLDSPAPTPRTEEVDESALEQGSERQQTRAAADDSAVRVGLLNNPAALRDEWERLQGTFVDDPQQAVHEASALIERTLREIQENVFREQITDSASTEELRVSFRRYREFFQRLLSA
jgi:hypothetical protein